MVCGADSELDALIVDLQANTLCTAASAESRINLKALDINERVHDSNSMWRSASLVEVVPP